ncbi:hypothetical protein OG804_28690 [Nocardia sp. NBC_00416]
MDKLLRAGGAWPAAHPECGWITRRYLARRRALVRVATRASPSSTNRTWRSWARSTRRRCATSTRRSAPPRASAGAATNVLAAAAARGQDVASLRDRMAGRL